MAQFADPYSLPIDKVDPSNGGLFQSQEHWAYFRRLRDEDPIHFVDSEEFGPYWSITRFEDIVYVDSHHEQFSSEPSIVIGDRESEEFDPAMFIAMDPPKHDVQRGAVSPGVGPARLAEVEDLIRSRTAEVLDSLPVGEEFNWVEAVSIELTTRMLATLFDFPYEERAKLTYWSDVTTSGPAVSGPTSGELDMPLEERQAILLDCLKRFTELWQERAAAPPKEDFISLLAHHPETKDMQPMEFMGNLMLLIVGGNDTTRNSISAGVLALNENPAEYDKLRADPAIIPNMVSEIIRWQTPLAYMRRTANQDAEIRGKQIKAGDQVLMWYVSGNRDGDIIDRPDEFLIDRPKARHHLSFGFGIHRCMGNRLAEMQLRILWEEIQQRFHKVEVVGEPQRLRSSFVRGITELPVRVHPL